jgi:hypothetical protein
MAKGEWRKTTDLIDAATRVLKEQHPMTIRQLFYQLVSRGTLPNNIKSYQLVSRIMTKAREDGRIDFDYIVDRSRPAYSPNVWADAGGYAEAVKRGYRKDYWSMQPNHVEILVEKDAIIGSIEPVTDELGVTIRVGRGFQSTTRIHEIADHLKRIEKPITIFYLGDHDPSGVAIENDLESRLREYGATFRIRRLAIFKKDINAFKLPPLRIKDTDSRATSFRSEYGTDCVELDALPPEELRRRLRQAIDNLIDHNLWDRAIAVEKVELASIRTATKMWSGVSNV